MFSFENPSMLPILYLNLAVVLQKLNNFFLASDSLRFFEFELYCNKIRY